MRIECGLTVRVSRTGQQVKGKRWKITDCEESI